MHKIVLSKNFRRELERKVKQDPELWTRVSKTLILLAKDLKHPSLRLHKLSGKNNWSVSISKSYRIVLSIENGVIYCTKFGTHDEVY